MFRKIWNDPVGSKVIAVAILGLLSVIYNLGTALFRGQKFTDTLLQFFLLKIELWILFVVVVATLSLITIYQFERNKKQTNVLYDAKALALDTELFERIKKDILYQDSTIIWLRTENFGGHSFKDKLLDPLHKILEESYKSDFAFLNKELEIAKDNLVNEINNFISLIGKHTFAAGPNKQTVPPEWEYQQPERFDLATRELNESADQVYEQYDKFIKLGRRILKV